MITIKTVEIHNFRSIRNIEFRIDHAFNLIAICGENNVGKTNCLKAIDLFFYPDKYDAVKDRPTLKQAQGGARIDTKIVMTFYDSSTTMFYTLTRDFKFENHPSRKLVGKKYRLLANKTKGRASILAKDEAKKVLESIEFCYIESINIDIPKLIENLTNDAIDIEYQKTRFTNSKKDLKTAFDKYSSGLQEILNIFSRKISDSFNQFKENWDIQFRVPASSETFRDIISKDIELLIDDKGCLHVEQKGSGLQRLAVILLNFEILKRMTKLKSFIVCIDEPDIYLHEGLQRKLMHFFKEKSDEGFQIIYTSHSNIFIDQYAMKNTFLLSAKHSLQYSVRKKKNINVVDTINVDISTPDGYDRICQHLGIEANNYNILKKENIMVEGECDKKYLLELGKLFSITLPNIISVDGVTNMTSTLTHYNTYYKDNTMSYIPKIKVLFDNDRAGRDEYNKVSRKNFSNLATEYIKIHNYTGTTSATANHEIEDFIYPDITCYLLNQILEKKGMKKIKIGDVVKQIAQPAFLNSGILNLLEYEKNKSNPQNTNLSVNSLKKNLAEQFNLTGDRVLAKTVRQCDSNYPYVREFIIKLSSFASE